MKHALMIGGTPPCWPYKFVYGREAVIELILDWGVLLIFAGVLIAQMGLPLPCAPLLICAGAVSSQAIPMAGYFLLSSVAACLIADHLWFALGRRYGRRLLARICQLSLSPDVCVSDADHLMARHGPSILVFAKFIPGVSAVGIPTAAAAGLSYPKFFRIDLLACVIWSSFYLAVGFIFSRQVEQLLVFLNLLGRGAFEAVGLLLVLFLTWKFLYRWRLRRLFRLVRIGADELLTLLNVDPQLIVLDARSPTALAADPRLVPFKHLSDPKIIEAFVRTGSQTQTVVTFCTCPSEASAAVLADRLRKAGFLKVHVLVGGSDAITHLENSLVMKPQPQALVGA